MVLTHASVSGVKAPTLSRIVRCKTLITKRRIKIRPTNPRTKSRTKTLMNLRNKARVGLAAWKYLEPKDLAKPLTEDGKEWKFCTK
jgi:hypothetical protein